MYHNAISSRKVIPTSCGADSDKKQMKTEDFIKQIAEHGLNEEDLKVFTLPTFEERLAEYRIACPHTGYYIALTDSLKLIETSRVMYGGQLPRS